MAFEKSFTDKNGIVHDKAYHRILSINIDFQEELGRAEVGIYIDKDARDSGKEPFESKRYFAPVEDSFDETTGELLEEGVTFDEIFGSVLDNKNPRKSVYDYLTQKDYKDAKAA